MVLFSILSGRHAGAETPARRFPFRLGRSADSQLRLEEDGVWDRHAELSFSPVGFVLAACGDALLLVNGQPVREVVLRNGDEIALGGSRLRFWLDAARQSSLRLREWLTWLAFLALTALQIYLIYTIAP